MEDKQRSLFEVVKTDVRDYDIYVRVVDRIDYKDNIPHIISHDEIAPPPPTEPVYTVICARCKTIVSSHLGQLSMSDAVKWAARWTHEVNEGDGYARHECKIPLRSVK